MFKRAVSRGKAGHLAASGVDAVEGFKKDVEVRLEFHFVGSPGGATEKNGIVSVTQSIGIGIGRIKNRYGVTGFFKIFADGFGDTFRVPGRGTIHNQYLAHALFSKRLLAQG